MRPFAAVAALLSSLFINTNAYAEIPDNAVWIDVRTPEEFAGGHLEGAHNIPHGEIEAGVAALGLDTEIPIYLYCRSGNRSGIAARALAQKGYNNLTNAGGLDDARALAQAQN